MSVDDPAPYLSVVVTTRNDDHGGHPLERLQAFVTCFDEQCRRTGLDAEVIVVEWNPPPERPSVASVLRRPSPQTCTYRFIEVPPEIHQRLRYADVLPLFQMIGKNVGVRRARGQFVLATNIDVVLSTELVNVIASRQLQSGHLYRVDRHDIAADLPVDASLEEQMAYCASHQLRVHSRSGSHPVDPAGRPVSLAADIVDGRSVRLGEGWHVCEGDGAPGLYRWASDRADLAVDLSTAGIGDRALLDLDLESNPYDARSWVKVLVLEDDTPRLHVEVSGRTQLQVPLRPGQRDRPRRIELRVTDESPRSREHLPAFERRDTLRYRVFSVGLQPDRDEVSRLTSERIEGAVEAAELVVPPKTTPSLLASFRDAVWRRRARWSGRARVSSLANWIGGVIAVSIGDRMRYRIVSAAPEFKAVGEALRASDAQLRELAPLRHLAPFNTFLREHRPDNLHVNACGDFQLMARVDWERLRGYPEFETFSMNVDGLFSYIAHAAGIQEHALDAPIYHLEHAVGSGWSPEGEALLRRRIAERGITWLDATTAYIWAAYMRSLGRPMIFNADSWGFAGDVLPEQTMASPTTAGGANAARRSVS